MKKGLKLSALLMSAVVAAGVFAGCGNGAENTEANENTEAEQSVVETVPVNVAMLKGPTGIGAVELMEKSANGESEGTYNFSVAAAPTEVNAKILSGEVDIAAVPTNLASVLYNKTEGEVSVLALNTLGVLYIVDNGAEIESIADLEGKTICTSGQGAVPEYVLDYILEENGIENVTVDYKAEHAEVAAAIADGTAQVAMLPEPNVTAVTMKNENVKVALDMTEEWDKISDDTMAMGCVIVRNEFLAEHPETVALFLDEYEESINFVNENVADASLLVEKFGIMPAAKAAEKAIPSCNIVYEDGEEMKSVLTGFYEVLFNADAKSVGGKLPDDNFYYIEK